MLQCGDGGKSCEWLSECAGMGVCRASRKTGQCWRRFEAPSSRIRHMLFHPVPT
jgi:hypothetical protein